jgi:hypothetical protein
MIAIFWRFTKRETSRTWVKSTTRPTNYNPMNISKNNILDAYQKLYFFSLMM